jgi:hypothetical protein
MRDGDASTRPQDRAEHAMDPDNRFVMRPVRIAVSPKRTA